jgi:Flp pilus assembly protein TadG
MLNKFLRCRRGNFALMSALLLPVMLTAVGLAVDYTNLSGARAKLQSALDAALLAASRLKDSNESRTSVFDAVLGANLDNEPVVLSYAGTLTVTKGANYIKTEGRLTARIELFFLDHVPGAGSLRVEASAYESSDELEVAMVLDNTGSMGDAGMKALREAATALVDILESVKSNSRNVRAALVPFVTAVNVKGEGFKGSWIDMDADAPLHGANFEPKNGNHVYNHLDLFKHLKVEWKGCVEARPAPYNLDDSEPTRSSPATLFVPYFAPDNPGPAAKSPNSSSTWNNSYLGDTIGKSEKQKQKEIVRYLASSTQHYIDEKGPRSTGPNYACPTPIEPLTSDFTKLRAAVASMIQWEGSGTNVSEGLAWGMRVLSPEEPYTQGKAFKSANISKAVVLFTDGENNVFGASSEQFNTSDYGAYGFLDSGRMGTTDRKSALSTVNAWTQTMCTRLKDKEVQIFTVLLGADTKANRDLYTKCASSPDNYYPTKDITELRLIFEKIGSKIAKLQLTQ